MEDIKEQIKDLLESVKADEFRIYHASWKVRAVQALNDYYYEQNRCEGEIFDTASKEWESLVIEQAKRGWGRVKLFLNNLGSEAEWATLDGYGNAEGVMAIDLLERLKDVRKELSHED